MSPRPAAIAMCLVVVAGCDRQQQQQPVAPPPPPAAPVAAPVPEPPPPPDMTTVSSADGSWVIGFRPGPDAIPLNEMFSLTVTVHDGAGAPVDGIDLLVDAAMPDHRHGMVLQPKVTASDDGTWLVEGMLFHMPGYWELYFDVTRDGLTERAQVPVQLE